MTTWIHSNVCTYHWSWEQIDMYSKFCNWYCNLSGLQEFRIITWSIKRFKDSEAQSWPSSYQSTDNGNHGKSVLGGYIILCRKLLSIQGKKRNIFCPVYMQNTWQVIRLANPYQQNFAFSYYFCECSNLRFFFSKYCNARFC